MPLQENCYDQIKAKEGVMAGTIALVLSNTALWAVLVWSPRASAPMNGLRGLQ